MMKLMCALVMASAVFSLGSTAEAGPATDSLGKCLTDSSTGKDRVIFVRWMFSSLSTHPDVQSIANITDAQRSAFSHQAAEVFNRLILRDCRAETVAAIREDGTHAVEQGFEVFGRVAATQLMADPAVQKSMSGLGSDMDEKGLAELLQEAKAK